MNNTLLWIYLLATASTAVTGVIARTSVLLGEQQERVEQERKQKLRSEVQRIRGEGIDDPIEPGSSLKGGPGTSPTSVGYLVRVADLAEKELRQLRDSASPDPKDLEVAERFHGAVHSLLLLDDPKIRLSQARRRYQSMVDLREAHRFGNPYEYASLEVLGAHRESSFPHPLAARKAEAAQKFLRDFHNLGVWTKDSWLCDPTLIVTAVADLLGSAREAGHDTGVRPADLKLFASLEKLDRRSRELVDPLELSLELRTEELKGGRTLERLSEHLRKADSALIRKELPVPGHEVLAAEQRLMEALHRLDPRLAEDTRAYLKVNVDRVEERIRKEAPSSTDSWVQWGHASWAAGERHKVEHYKAVRDPRRLLHSGSAAISPQAIAAARRGGTPNTGRSAQSRLRDRLGRGATRGR